MRSPQLFVRDPNVIKQLAVKDFDHFEDHPLFVDHHTDKLLGNSLIMLTGSKWRDMRATLSPAFTGSKMRQMYELVGDTAFDMSEYLKGKTANGQELHAEMKEMFSKYTNDVIATAAFGLKVNSFQDGENEFFRSGTKLVDFTGLMISFKAVLARVAPRLMERLGIQFLDAEASKFFKSIILKTIDVRTKEHIYRPDMVNIMMQLRNGQTQVAAVADEEKVPADGFATVEESSIGKAAVQRQWNDDEIVAQCLLFFVAGFETSSSVLMFAAYELAKRPETQAKLFAEVSEIDRKLNGKKLPYEELQKMKYLDQVVTETLRLWPPAPMTDRVCVRDYEYNDGEKKFRLDKGTYLWIPIYSIHRDPKYYPQPELFEPDRFSDENKGGLVAGAYMPFGVGPRNCIGSRFALMEVKAVIYYLALNFQFVPNEKTEFPLQFIPNQASITIKNGVHLQLVPRK